jgi:hypothetical protein
VAVGLAAVLFLSFAARFVFGRLRQRLRPGPIGPFQHPKDGYRFVDFGCGAGADSGAIADLHLTLLPDSSLPRMGRPFLKHFYYSVLPDEGLIFGSIAYVDGIPAGFVVNTPYPGEYMRLAIRRHPVRFAVQAARAFLAKPSRAVAALRARKRITAPPARPNEVRTPRRYVEGLFLGVAPEFIRSPGLHISRDLMDRALRQAAAFAPEIRSPIMRTNVAALMLHLNTGWKIVKDDRVLPISADHLELSHTLEREQPGA